MSKNIGKVDRALRFCLSLLLFLFAWWQASWIVFGIALFVLYESLAGWCCILPIVR